MAIKLSDKEKTLWQIEKLKDEKDDVKFQIDKLLSYFLGLVVFIGTIAITTGFAIKGVIVTIVTGISYLILLSIMHFVAFKPKIKERTAVLENIKQDIEWEYAKLGVHSNTLENEPIKIITAKTKGFDTWRDLLIKKQEIDVNKHIQLVLGNLNTFITCILALIIAYIGWRDTAIQNAFINFWQASLLGKIFIIGIIIIIIYVCYKIGWSIINRPAISKKVLNSFNVTRYKEADKILNKLYFAKIEPEKWAIKVHVNEDEGLFELKEIRKISQ